jgi:hypothetical protein
LKEYSALLQAEGELHLARYGIDSARHVLSILDRYDRECSYARSYPEEQIEPMGEPETLDHFSRRWRRYSLPTQAELELHQKRFDNIDDTRQMTQMLEYYAQECQRKA